MDDRSSRIVSAANKQSLMCVLLAGILSMQVVHHLGGGYDSTSEYKFELGGVENKHYEGHQFMVLRDGRSTTVLHNPNCRKCRGGY